MVNENDALVRAVIRRKMVWVGGFLTPRRQAERYCVYFEERCLLTDRRNAKQGITDQPPTWNQSFRLYNYNFKTLAEATAYAKDDLSKEQPRLAKIKALNEEPETIIYPE